MSSGGDVDGEKSQSIDGSVVVVVALTVVVVVEAAVLDVDC